MENTDLMKGRFELLKMKSDDAAEILEDGVYDFVFIDGDHSIKAVLNDLDRYVSKIRKGGILAGHDIGLSSVNMAVGAWTRRKYIDPKKINLVENHAWFWVVE
jgi:predicted O-methyltransferase YrrM